MNLESVNKIFLQGRGPLGKLAWKTQNQGLDSSFCLWIVGQRFTLKECFFTNTGIAKARPGLQKLRSMSNPAGPTSSLRFKRCGCGRRSNYQISNMCLLLFYRVRVYLCLFGKEVSDIWCLALRCVSVGCRLITVNDKRMSTASNVAELRLVRQWSESCWFPVWYGMVWYNIIYRFVYVCVYI